MNEQPAFSELIQKLDRFIRKYYQNQLIRGGIYFAGLTLLFFLLVITLEYFGRYQSLVRAGLFYGFLAGTLGCLVRFVIVPLSKLYRLGNVIDYTQASVIIGAHFPEVKDKLLNVLQLKQQSSGTDQSLMGAAIEQKTAELKPIPFASAINLQSNVRYLRFVAVPLILYAAIYLVAPSMITDSTKRVIRYNETFKAAAPFEFSLLAPRTASQQFTDIQVEVGVSGQQLPQEVYLLFDGNRYKMQAKDKQHFVFTLSNVKQDEFIQFEAASFVSDVYELKVVAKPLIVGYKAKILYPAYLNKKQEWVENPGDMTLPIGSIVEWQFATSNTDKVELVFGNTYFAAVSEDKDRHVYKRKFFTGGKYRIITSNSTAGVKDSLEYEIGVIPDAFPQLSVEGKQDSADNKQLFFIGDATDDHGLTRLAFHYRITTEEGKAKPGIIKWIPIEKGNNARFYFQFNLSELQLNPGEVVSYYFEVWDNDGVHGSKSTKSALKELRTPSVKELEEKTEAGSTALKEKMEQAMKDAKTLQKELKDLERKMQEKRELTWEEKKKAEKLLEQQKELARKLDQIKKEQEQLKKEEEEYRQQSEQILEKQQQLEKMFNELMDEEMKKLIQEMEKMLQMQQKDQMKQELEKMQLNNKDVEKELDRMLEQYKKLELEKKLEETTKKLDDLSDKQQKLSEETEKPNKQLNNEEQKQRKEELKKSQEELNKSFKELKEDLKEIAEENKQLEEPEELENTDQEEKEIEENQEGSKQDIEKGDQKKASEKQQKAAQKMKQMSQKMKDKKAEREQKELELDAQALREILENTIQLSKDQESLMDQMKAITGYNPQFVEAAQTQKKIKDNAKIIEDSLLALSKRVAEISSFINREVSKMNENLDRSVKGFSVRNFQEIRTRQQYSMTHANNLAVMLSEVLKQMQDQMQGEGESDGKGKPKPGKGKGKGKSGNKPRSMGELKKAQEELNKQLREGLNKQQQKGDKLGEQGKPGMGGLGSQEFARMAAQQQAIRQQMQKMLQQLGAKEKEGLGGNAKLQEMQRLMEQTEKELYNKQLSNQLLQRQQDIMTRMLESEKAERKQEQDQRREAEKAKEKPATTPPAFEQYIKQKNKEKELLETIPADMQPYYKEKTKTYFNKIGGKR